MRGGALLAALALVAAPAAAQEAQPQQGRIWKGTLGDQAITACFFEENGPEGVFYIDAALEPIRLEPDGDAGLSDLREMRSYDDPTGAVWSLNLRTSGRIEGAWRKDGETLPIRLAAETVTLPEYGTACETGAFLDRLLVGGTITKKRESRDGVAYTVLEYAGPPRSGLEDYSITTFALDPVRPGDEAINRAFAAEIPDGTAGHEAGQCLAGSLSWSSGSGDYGKFQQPTLITSRWIGVSITGSSYCGGAHPNHFITARVYDRDSGAAVDPSAWFKSGALMFYDWEPGPGKNRPIAGLSKALTKALLAQSPPREEGDDCGTIVGEGFSWKIGLTQEGPVFVPQLPHAAFGCTEEIVLPWQEARPFLSAEGRAVMDSLR